jgi:hypothetical protein
MLLIPIPFEQIPVATGIPIPYGRRRWKGEREGMGREKRCKLDDGIVVK